MFSKEHFLKACSPTSMRHRRLLPRAKVCARERARENKKKKREKKSEFFSCFTESQCTDVCYRTERKTKREREKKRGFFFFTEISAPQTCAAVRKGLCEKGEKKEREKKRNQIFFLLPFLNVKIFVRERESA